jgi:hypothetical protein
MAQEKYLDILSLSGDILFRVLIREQSTVPQNGNGQTVKSEPRNGSQSSEEEPITGPQLKLLFRIYAGKGIYKDSAESEILKLFGVSHVSEITKLEAMKKIDSLLKETKGGNGKNGSFVSKPN